jgi:ABC-type nitrate/sulfonate/bicarbonate transport system permease component
MVTLGLVGYASSALIRALGRRLMRWREQAIGGH